MPSVSGKGYFGEADGGTIFLDEVGELPLPTQARLLRVLESGEFIKVGSSKVQKDGCPHCGCYQREPDPGHCRGTLSGKICTIGLNTVPIQIPPLRERGDDVLLLFRKFASRLCRKVPDAGYPADGRCQEDIAVLIPWPGNVRQLKNITEQISIIETNREITAAILQTYLPAQNTQRLAGTVRHTREQEL